MLWYVERQDTHNELARHATDALTPNITPNTWINLHNPNVKSRSFKTVRSLRSRPHLSLVAEISVCKSQTVVWAPLVLIFSLDTLEERCYCLYKTKVRHGCSVFIFVVSGLQVSKSTPFGCQNQIPLDVSDRRRREFIRFYNYCDDCSFLFVVTSKIAASKYEWPEKSRFSYFSPAFGKNTARPPSGKPWSNIYPALLRLVVE